MTEIASGLPFVGRRRELAALQTRLDESAHGRGGLVLLVGEAGIGKTETAREFAAAARSREALVMWGACFEEEWSPPYAPWVEMLTEFVRRVEPDQLVRLLGPGAPFLAQLIPELRVLLPHVPRAAALGQGEERFRLYDAVAQFLLAIARETPVVVVLDDLHWADRDSLRLFSYLVRFAGRARLLIVGTYRDDEVGHASDDAFADTLAILSREAASAHVRLRGLTTSETAEYLTRASHTEFPRALVDVIHAETGGNPFYTREVLRHLLEEHKVVRRSNRWSTDFSMAELGIPAGVRHVVGRRLSRLSETTRQILRLAAAISGAFDFRILQELGDLSEEALLDCLDEALKAGLIRVLDGPTTTYDFSHAIVRHTLDEERNPDRRARLHRRVAVALERVYADRLAEHAAELAAQYHASARLPGADAGISYCLTAAEQARGVYARDRAVTFLRMAREIATEATASVRAPILTALATAEAEALLLDDAGRSIEEAVATLAQAGVEPPARAEFLAAAVRALQDGGASHLVCEPLLERGLGLVDDRRNLIWARLMLLRDRVEMVSNGPITAGRWLGYDPEAVRIARSSGDEDDYARTLQPFDWRTREETEGVYALAQTWQRPGAVMRALDVVARDCIYHHGAISEAVERLRELLVIAEQTGSIPGQAEALVQLALCQSILGDLAIAQETERRAREVVTRLGTVHRLHVVVDAALGSVLGYFLGANWSALALAADQFARYPVTSRGPLGLTAASFAVYDYFRAGEHREARRYLAAITPLFEQLGPTTYIYNGSLDRVATAVWEMGAVEYATHYQRLALDLLGTGAAGSPLCSNALTVARMAALLGDQAVAREYFGRARAALDASGQRSLRAIVEYDEALAMSRFGSNDEVRIAALLDDAVARFATLYMDEWRVRAATLRQEHDALHQSTTSPTPYPDGLTTREVEVLRLIAAGRTNKEVATALVVSVPTVQRHIANIYGKINARGRADATAYAIKHGISAL